MQRSQIGIKAKDLSRKVRSHYYSGLRRRGVADADRPTKTTPGLCRTGNKLSNYTVI